MRKTTAIALKLFAIYLIFNLAIALPSILTIGLMSNRASDHAGSISPMLILVFLSFVIGAVAIVVIWKTANSLVDTPEAEHAEETQLDLDKMFRYALMLLGLYFGIKALISLPTAWLPVVNNHGSIGDDYSVVSFSCKVAQLILGGYLVFRPRRCLRFLKKWENEAE